MRTVKILIASFTLFLLLSCAHTGMMPPGKRATVLLLPVMPKDDTSREFCDRLTSALADELVELDLFYLVVSKNLLEEYRLQRYRYDHADLQKRILEIAEPDYVLSGSIQSNGNQGEYSFGLELANFGKLGNHYNDVYFGMRDIETMVGKHVGRIKRLGVFLPDPEAAREEYLAILKAHSPETFPILAGKPKKQQEHFLLGYIPSDRTLSGGFNTAVHEGFHASAYTGRPDQMALYISTRDTVIVTTTPTFPTCRLVAVVPADLRTERFELYTTPPHPGAATQTMGIYALLNELGAYYQGTRVSCDLFSYYKEELFGEDIETYFEFLSGMYGSYAAYYEFKFLIYTYLLYAQKEEPAVYKGIARNARFKEAFKKLDAAFGRLVHRIYEIEGELNEYLEPRGLRLYKDGKFTFISRIGGAGAGRSNYQDEMQLLEEELRGEKYRTLEREFFQ